MFDGRYVEQWRRAGVGSMSVLLVEQLSAKGLVAPPERQAGESPTSEAFIAAGVIKPAAMTENYHAYTRSLLKWLNSSGTDRDASIAQSLIDAGVV